MRRWTMWAASAVGAAGAGAGIALARHRRRADDPAGHLATPTPTPPPPAPDAVAPPADDPQAALDAARERLRSRADELRRDIESSGGPAGGA